MHQARPTSRDSVLVVVPDRSRECPLELVLPSLFGGLVERGVAPERVTVAIASGSHVASAADVARLGILPADVRLLRHDADGPAAAVGTTSRGTEVRVHAALLEADVVLAVGPLVLHYFAGFGGGGKMLFPGLGERTSIAANHRLSLAETRGLADGVEPGRTIGNPVAEDLREAHRLLPPAHHLSLVQEEGAWLAAPWSDFADFDRLCSTYRTMRTFGDRHAADVVWVHQPALDVVQAHKLLFHAALYAKDGAEIILDAGCPERVGSPALARWLARPDRATLEADARAHYELNAQTAISLAAIAERTRVTWYPYRPIPELERWGITMVDDLVPAVLRVTEIHDAGGTVVQLDRPGLTIPQATPAL